MNKRLEQFLAAENISQSQFADTIGVARASISHILAGRNKPGFDFIESTARHYPSLNIEWLILGTGKMYRNAAASQAENLHPQPSGLLFGTLSDDQSPIPEMENEPAGNSFRPEPEPFREAPAPQRIHTESETIGNRTQKLNNQRNISRIIVFYDDNTYQELK